MSAETPHPIPDLVIAVYEQPDGTAMVALWLDLRAPQVRDHYLEHVPAPFGACRPDEFLYREVTLGAKRYGMVVGGSLAEAWAKLPGLAEAMGTPLPNALTSVVQQPRTGGTTMVLDPHVDRIVQQMLKDDGEYADRTSPEQYRAWATAVLDAARALGLELVERPPTSPAGHQPPAVGSAPAPHTTAGVTP